MDHKALIGIAAAVSFALNAQARIVPTFDTYQDISEVAALVSDSDLANLGQATFSDSTVSANQRPEKPKEVSFIDGAASGEDFQDITWFHDSKGHLPATVTLNLDVTANTSGYDISEIASIAGWRAGEQADQILTVEYSVVGRDGWTQLGSAAFSYTAPGSEQYSRIVLSDDAADYLATGVDALRFSYAVSGNHLLLQEIDVEGVPHKVDIPESARIGMLSGLLALGSVMLRRRR